MRRLVLLAAGFVYMVALIEAIRAGVAWWRGELLAPGPLDIALVAALPVLVWIWWRYISPFGCAKGACLTQDKRPGAGQD